MPETKSLIRTFRYRLYPTKPQEAALLETLRLTRQLYNAALEQRREAYRKCGVSLRGHTQEKEIRAVCEALPEYQQVYSHVLQDVFTRLDRAYDRFFSRVKQGVKAGFPRFKSQNRWHSFKFKEVWDRARGRWLSPGRPQGDGKRINLPKIGSVKCKFHRPLEGIPRTLEIVLDVDQWYAIYTCEVPVKELPALDNCVGLDVGTTWFAVSSDGDFIANPKPLAKRLRQLRTQQRTVARRRKGGNRRRKAVQQAARTHRKIRRSRLDFHHKTARKLVSEHQTIVHEGLIPANMVRGKLARSISDVGWGQFFTLLSSKAEEAGRTIIKVPPHHTSQTCFACGHISKENRLSQSKFRCVACGVEENADLNAARNIHRAGTRPSDLNGRGQPHAVV